MIIAAITIYTLLSLPQFGVAFPAVLHPFLALTSPDHPVSRLNHLGVVGEMVDDLEWKIAVDLSISDAATLVKQILI